MTHRESVKVLARGYIEKYGDTGRQAMREAWAFHASCLIVIGDRVLPAHARWAAERDRRLGITG